MKRRSFLKGLAVIPAAPAILKAGEKEVPPPVPPVCPKIEPGILHLEPQGCPIGDLFNASSTPLAFEWTEDELFPEQMTTIILLGGESE